MTIFCDRQRLELWGGAECTVNRTGSNYRDQSRLSGHHDRASDIDLFAGLGLTAIRYPILWERVAPDNPDAPHWRWSDERLGRLRELAIRPIVGLVHHGSGPAYAPLLGGDFAAGLGRYARQVAERYPWIEDWTPINEPLTTARFTGLYGHWYPHGRDERSFWCALLDEVDATREAMRAARTVNSRARLIQTDDLGRTYSTVRLAEQAEFDNLRRWAGWDLLFGRITREHPLWNHIARHGLADRLARVADDPCPPDVVGVNHYLTSDRFLDHRLDRYPAHTHGGNGRQAYADVEAVRVLDPPPAGLAGVLREAWQRYATPLAITEVHNGCTREEQLRWAAEAWDSAETARAEGVDIRAVTAWSLLGSHSWDRLLTAEGSYEPGVFDAATGTPRPTALAGLWASLARGETRHPVASQPGWWRRRDRLIYPIVPGSEAKAAPLRRRSPPLLICGATGTLGQAFARACTARGIRHVVSGREIVDLARPERIGSVLAEVAPWAVVNAAGWVRVDDAEDAEDACHQVNAAGATALAEACAQRGIACLNFSSDLVFDGSREQPYVEDDPARPLGAYGRSKAAMEAACAGLPHSLIVRTAAFFSPHDQYNFAAAVHDSLAGGTRFAAAADHFVTPTFVPQLVDHALDLLIDGASGLWHLTNGVAVSWSDFARRIAVACGHDERLVDAVPGADLAWRAPRPRFAALGSTRTSAIGNLDEAIMRFAADAGRRSRRRAGAYEEAQPIMAHALT